MKTKTCIAGILLATALADAETVTRQHLVLASNATVVLTATATNDLNSALQRGLFEEEGNRDLSAAISAYQSLAAQFDQSRQVAATAIFRLGECYRKLGKTNEAVVQYERVTREFSDQQTLTTLSRQNIAGLGSAAQTSAPASVSGATLGNLQSQYALLKAKLEQARSQTNSALVAQLFNDDKELIEKLNQALSRVDSIRSAQAKTQANGTAEQIQTIERVLKDSQQGVENVRQQIFDLQEVRLKILQSAIQQTRPGQSQTLIAGGDETPSATDDEDKEIRRIQKMIQDSPDLINATGEAGMTPISQAAGAGWLRVVAFLLDHGAALDRSALLYATSSGNKAMVELLIARGADINQCHRRHRRHGAAPCGGERLFVGSGNFDSTRSQS